MKKLKLNLKEAGHTMLSKEQMKQVTGGYGYDPGSTCYINCYYNSTYIGQIDNIGTDVCPEDLSVPTYYCHQVFGPNGVTVGYCQCD